MATIALMGLPFGAGAGVAGCEHAPARLRDLGLARYLTPNGAALHDLGDVVPPTASTRLQAVLMLARRAARLARGAVERGELLLSLGGDHSVSLGPVRGVAARRTGLGLVWIDAHGDFNTPATSPSGNPHGMVLARLAGFGSHGAVPRTRVALLGVRDLDPRERLNLGRARISLVDSASLMWAPFRVGLTTAHRLARRGARVLYVSVDLDVIDPAWAPAVGTPVSGGITPAALYALLDGLAAGLPIVAADLVEYNPLLDASGDSVHVALTIVRRLARALVRGGRADLAAGA